MKAYKATFNFKCRNQEYKVGKTYTSNKLEICKYGIHYCEDMKNTLNYYFCNKNFVLLEIEILGKVITNGDKSVTDKMKVLRVVPKEEYDFGDNFVFDDNYNLISTTYRNHKYTYEYDQRRNIISVINSDGVKYILEYDERDNKISSTSQTGKTILKYDERNNLISILYPTGDGWTYEYDEKNNRISDTYSNGMKTTYEYDENGNMICLTYPSGHKITYEYATIVESD